MTIVASRASPREGGFLRPDELLPLGIWVPVLDGDPIAAAMYERHYSSARSLARRRERGVLQFCGPSARLVLMTPDRRALCAWRKHKVRDDAQAGVECSIFRNEGAALSSELIRAADAIADARWPGERHFTFVDERATARGRSRRSQPGECFRRAGWQECGRSKARDLLILERLP